MIRNYVKQYEAWRDLDPDDIDEIEFGTRKPSEKVLDQLFDDIKNDNLQGVKDYISCDYDVNAKDKSGKAPLKIAYDYDRNNIADLLLKNGAKKIRMLNKAEMKTSFGCINPNDYRYYDDLYLVGLWSGAGYLLDTMLVWGDDPNDVLEIAASWCEDNAHYLLVSDEDVHEIQGEYARETIAENPDKYGFTKEEVENINDMTMDEICNHIGDETWYELCDEALEYNDIMFFADEGLYIRGENARLKEVKPSDYEGDGVYPDDYEEKEDDDEDDD